MLSTFIGWIGTAFLAVSPPIIDSDLGKILALSGLALLTIQAIQTRMYNLIILNITGIIGYAYAIYI